MSSKTRGYKIDWTRNTFTMTKPFADKASQIGTEEYEQLMKVRANGFHVVEKKPKPRKACPTRLTYKKMSNYIATRSDYKKQFAEFNRAIEESKAHHNPYQYVREWFMNSFPDHIASLEAHRAKETVPLRLQVVSNLDDGKRDIA